MTAKQYAKLSVAEPSHRSQESSKLSASIKPMSTASICSRITPIENVLKLFKACQNKMEGIFVGTSKGNAPSQRRPRHKACLQERGQACGTIMKRNGSNHAANRLKKAYNRPNVFVVVNAREARPVVGMPCGRAVAPPCTWTRALCGGQLSVKVTRTILGHRSASRRKTRATRQKALNASKPKLRKMHHARGANAKHKQPQQARSTTR